MKVLVDTSVWSLAFRRRYLDPESSDAMVVSTLKELITDGVAVLIGPVRQELLSGVTNPSQYEKLRDGVRAFKDEHLVTEDYELAAQYFNTCRTHGVQGSHIDFLICAAAVRRKLHIFTTDKDFQSFSKHIPVTLYRI